jgi:hypothetical protein
MHRANMILFSLILLVLLVLPTAAQTTHFFDRTPYKILLQDETSLRELAQLNLDVERGSVMTGAQFVIAYLNSEEVNLLNSLGYQVETTPNEAYQGYLNWLQERPQIAETDDYHTYETLVSELQAIAEAHPNICQLTNIGPTVQGRALWFMKISDNAAVQEDEPEFRYISSLHGDEVVGKEMCMYLINYLVDNYGSDPAITDLVNSEEIWIMPSANPDGTANVSRFNAQGADLNRSFPDRVTDPYNVPAGHPQEVQDIMIWNFSHNPLFSANFHGGALVCNYPWDEGFDPQANAVYTTNQDVVLAASNTYSSNNLPMWNNNTAPFVHGIVNGATWYQISGGLQDWSYNWMGDMDITIELGNTKWPSYTLLPGLWNDNRPAMLAYMQYARKGIRGLVRNANTSAPLAAQVKVPNRPDFVTYTDPEVGDYHRILMPGTYNLDITSAGYWPAHLTNVVVPVGDAVHQDVNLQPATQMTFKGILHNPAGGGVSARLILMALPYANDTVTTNVNGQFNFPGVYEGEYRLRLEGLTDGAIVELPVTLNSGMDSLRLWGPVTVLYDGFETGLGSWITQGTWGTSGTAYTGSYSVSDSPSGNYGSNLNMALTRANPSNLTDYDNVSLSYRIKYNYETNFDSLFVEVSTDGSNWTKVKSHNSRQDVWSKEVVSLDAWAGTAASLRLRYRLVTDGSVARDGGFIDECRVCGVSTTPLAPPITNLDITLTPINPPIVVPANGGNFSFTVAVLNNGPTQQPYTAWARIKNPNGTYTAPTLGPVTINTPVGVTISRSRNQNVPGSWAAGLYSYLGYVNTTFTYPAVDSSSFTFTKSAVTDGGPLVTNAFCTGELFDGEAPVAALTPQNYVLAQNFPNPFNPTTQINFALPEAGRVSLKVFNAAGQLVTTLADGQFEAGWHAVTWDASNLSTGLYLYRLETGDRTITMKAILVK